MISVTDLGKTYGTRVLFTGVNLHLNPGERYGLVGANGSGKTTFLRVMVGEETASEGTIAIPRRLRLGVLRQDHFLSDDQRIIDVAMMGHAEVFNAMTEKDRLLEAPDGEFDHQRLSVLEDIVAQHDGYSLEAKAGEILEGLGIATAIHHQPLHTLSGGFKLRVLLAQALASKPDALLLDEPTNHLDIVSIRWLEKFLSTFPGIVVVISHDHRFLDNVCSRILDVDYERITEYVGNYQDFVEGKASHRGRMEAEIAKREKQIAEHQAFIDRFKAKSTKARQAGSKKKQMDRITIDRLPPSSRQHPKFKFHQARPSGRDVLKVEHLSKAYGEKQVLKDVSLTVQRGDRLAILGANGIGKSTLLKIAVGELSANSGTTEWGYEGRPGYFAQDLGPLRTSKTHTVLSYLWDACPSETMGFVRGQLGLVLFSGDDVEKPLTALSGGEAARLTFARLAVERPNVLVLDEPTNHLDLEAIEALVKGLQAFDGTLILVSHDRWFVGALATRILEVRADGMEDFRGTYAEYVAHCGDDHLDADTVLRQAKTKKPASDAGTSSAAAPSAATPAKAKPVNKGQRRKIEARHAETTAAIETLELRLRSIDATFCEPGYFERTSPEDVRALQDEQATLAARVDGLMEQWERLEEQLAAFRGDS